MEEQETITMSGVGIPNMTYRWVSCGNLIDRFWGDAKKAFKVTVDFLVEWI